MSQYKVLMVNFCVPHSELQTGANFELMKNQRWFIYMAALMVLMVVTFRVLFSEEVNLWCIS